MNYSTFNALEGYFHIRMTGLNYLVINFSSCSRMSYDEFEMNLYFILFIMLSLCKQTTSRNSKCHEILIFMLELAVPLSRHEYIDCKHKLHVTIRKVHVITIHHNLFL